MARGGPASAALKRADGLFGHVNLDVRTRGRVTPICDFAVGPPPGNDEVCRQRSEKLVIPRHSAGENDEKRREMMRNDEPILNLIIGAARPLLTSVNILRRRGARPVGECW
jgi:hypothetical protein